MKVSIVIPALNEAGGIATAIARALAAGADELIVVDGGSTDQTAALAAAHGCRVLSAPRGRGLQQNLGAREAAGSGLVFLHADCWLDPRAIDQVRAALADPNVVWGAFCQQIAAPQRAFRLLEWGNNLRARRWGRPLGDQGLWMRREALQLVGGFPQVPLMEDVLLARALRSLAWPRLLPGPIHASARRWQQRGIVRQTLRNWALLTGLRLGVSPQRLARHYR